MRVIDALIEENNLLQQEIERLLKEIKAIGEHCKQIKEGTAMHDEYETDVSGEVQEARELEHEAECRSRDIEQGIEPAGLYE